MLQQARPAPIAATLFAPDLFNDDSHATILLAAIGDIVGERAVILGQGAVDVMCALIRAGAPEVTELAHSARLDANSVDLMVVPNVASLDQAEATIRQARRALASAGRLVLRFPNDPAAHLARKTGQHLRLQGFSIVRQKRIGTQTVLTAELPLFGSSAKA
jgi:hypothetical protein